MKNKKDGTDRSGIINWYNKYSNDKIIEKPQKWNEWMNDSKYKSGSENHWRGRKIYKGYGWGCFGNLDGSKLFKYYKRLNVSNISQNRLKIVEQSY